MAKRLVLPGVMELAAMLCVLVTSLTGVIGHGFNWGLVYTSSNNLLLGSSITKSGLHRGPNTRYMLYNDTIKIYKLELKPK